MLKKSGRFELIQSEGIAVDRSDAIGSVDVDADSLSNADRTYRSKYMDVQAFSISLLVHVALIVTLGVVPLVVNKELRDLVLTSQPPEVVEKVIKIEDVAVSDEPTENIGANSTLADSGMAVSTAAVLAEMSQLPSVDFDEPQFDSQIQINTQLRQAVGLVRSQQSVKGMTGVGTTGTDGAVDRITYEILRSMEERPTLVVWFFDQSGSLERRRQEIRDRFDRIYSELGIVIDSGRSQRASDEVEPLLTSVYAFGSEVKLLTEKPTADLAEIKSAIDSIQLDSTGVETVFSSVMEAAQKYRRFRTRRNASGAERNVLFVVVSDERGDDVVHMDSAIRECTKLAIPVYVLGVPAPFGREFTYVKYVDPDPQFDQTPQWAQVDQGPESIMPERVQIGFRDTYETEPVIDSGFGPFALSRLAYETGGIYFTIHPNRRVGQRVSKRQIEAFASEMNYFFDPEVMVKYRPDYVSLDEYAKRVSSNPLRKTLVQAAQLPRLETLTDAPLRFVRSDDASLANQLTEAQQLAARVEPQLMMLVELLGRVEKNRTEEASPRWIAGYDLALGTAIANLVRAEGYNIMLTKVKRGQAFKNPESNTWVLEPSKSIEAGSRLEQAADRANEILTRVAAEHDGTPWGLLAQRELSQPFGWVWTETFTDLNPPREGNGNNNNALPNDDQMRPLQQPPPKRPTPKL